MAMCTGITSIRTTGFLCVALGINSFDMLIIYREGIDLFWKWPYTANYRFTNQLMSNCWLFFVLRENLTRSIITQCERLKKETIELLTLIYSANTRRDKQEVLQESRERIEAIRLLILLIKDMKQISVKKFVQINEEVENVSKQLSEWQ